MTGDAVNGIGELDGTKVVIVAETGDSVGDTVGTMDIEGGEELVFYGISETDGAVE